MFKRLFDLLASVFGLLVLSPIFIIIALWIKSDSQGEVFFRQVRVGRYGREFKIHKFRTMKVNAQTIGGGLTVGADKRVTRVGQYLRKYKLDELPQLIDVFLGNMSLVGPRPEIPEFMNKYPDEIRQKILSVKPGITDRASIEMVNENEILGQYEDAHQAYIDIIMPKKAKYYLEYVDNHSVIGDIQIVLDTIRTIIYR